MFTEKWHYEMKTIYRHRWIITLLMIVWPCVQMLGQDSYQQFEEQKQRCINIQYRISNVHNRLVDLNFTNPSIERALQDSINHLNAELDDALVQFDNIDASDKVMKTSVKNAKANIKSFKKDLKKCEKMLKKMRGRTLSGSPYRGRD